MDTGRGGWMVPVVLFIPLIVCTLSQEKEDFVDELDCPFLCTCANYDVNCTNTNLFPDDIPDETKRLFISSSNLEYVPINAFLNLKFVAEIHFINCNITKLRACSFAELENLTTISFEDTRIDKIEGNAFSNLLNVSFIRFYGVTIGEILSFSFHNFRQIGRIEFFYSNISTIHPYAFLSFDTVEEIGIMDCNIERFLKDAFSRFSNVDIMYMTGSNIRLWQCGSLDTLIASNVSFPVSMSRFTCDCTLAWLWIKHTNSTIVFNSSNKCFGTSAALATMNVNQVCPLDESRDKGCPPLLPSTPHTCSRSFDSPKIPVEKVTYPNYFSRDTGVESSACTLSVTTGFAHVTLPINVALVIFAVL